MENAYVKLDISNGTTVVFSAKLQGVHSVIKKTIAQSVMSNKNSTLKLFRASVTVNKTLTLMVANVFTVQKKLLDAHSAKT